MSIETANRPGLAAGKPISSDDFISLVAALTPQLTFILDSDTGEIRYNAEQVACVLGYSAEELNSPYFLAEEILHPEDMTMLTGGAIANATVRMRHGNGAYAAFNCRVRQHAGMHVIIATPQENGAVARNGLQLESTVSELQRSNRELEEFAYVASHDLQEPLRKISTFASRLAEKFPDQRSYDDAQQYISRICSSAENMRQLINNLLDFSRVTKVSEPPTTVNMNVVLREVKADLELIIEETGTVIIADKLPAIQGHFSQMKQLVHNMLTNAIKFRKQGQAPELNITCEDVMYHDRPFHKLQFCDNGIGFEEQYATRIFQIFQRLHGKAEYPGSGIGLAICKKIVEHHGGEITASNIPGQGACFTILLPAQNIHA